MAKPPEIQHRHDGWTVRLRADHVVLWKCLLWLSLGGLVFLGIGVAGVLELFETDDGGSAFWMGVGFLGFGVPITALAPVYLLRAADDVRLHLLQGVLQVTARGFWVRGCTYEVDLAEVEAEVRSCALILPSGTVWLPGDRAFIRDTLVPLLQDAAERADRLAGPQVPMPAGLRALRER